MRPFHFIYDGENRVWTFELTENDLRRLRRAFNRFFRFRRYLKLDDGTLIKLTGLRFVVPLQESEKEQEDHAPPAEFAEDVFLYNQGYYDKDEEGED